MPAHEALIARSGDLKRELLKFARGARYRYALRQAMEKQFSKIVVGDEPDVANFYDYFVLQHRLTDGRTVVERFVDAHPELPEAERAMLLGWRDVVDGIFVVRGRDGEALLVENLVDELTYRVRSNMGPGVFASMATGSFLVTRLVPVDEEWLLSGYSGTFPASSAAAAYEVAAKEAVQHPRLVFRNPAKVAQGWELQREERRSFIDFFGSDLFVLPGHQLAERMRAFMHYRHYELRDADGQSAADRALRAYGMVPKLPEFALPDDLTQADTVGVIYDEVDGLNFLAHFGLVEETFAKPELAADRRHRQVVLGYLKSSSISPRLLRRLAERDSAAASRVFQQVLKQPDFSWERDGEALLPRYKASYFERPVLPGVTPLSGRLGRARLGVAATSAAASGGRRPGRNDPCPCGSGKKYRQCCGR